jgi:hypothetical protein
MVFTYNKLKSSAQPQQIPILTLTQNTRYRTLTNINTTRSNMNSIIHNIKSSCSSCGN